MSLEVEYKGVQIAQLTQDGSLTLNTQGKYCEGDIELTYSGGGATPTGTINITVNDTYDVTQYASAVVNVPTGGSGRGYATGSVTLAENSETIEFNPNLNFTPSIVIIEAQIPDYTVDGCIGAVCVIGISDKIRNSTDGKEYQLHAVFETRSTYATYAMVQANTGVIPTPMSISSNLVVVPCRSTVYKWQAGTYTWRAWE